jgi:hypothetical protein
MAPNITVQLFGRRRAQLRGDNGVRRGAPDGAGDLHREEAARRDRFDFRPQARNRIVMNARKQPTVAPLFVMETRNEPSAQNGALDLQSGERACKRMRLEAFWFLLSRARPLSSGALNLVVPQEGFEPPTPSLRKPYPTPTH